MVEKPYPQFTFPSFRGVNDRGEVVPVTKGTVTVAFADGGSAEVRDDDLFAETEELQPRSLLASLFDPVIAGEGDDVTDSPVSAGGFRARIYDLLSPPGYERHENPAADPRTKQWLRERIADLHPGREPERLTVTWIRSIYRETGEDVPVETETRGSVEVEL